MIMKAQQHTPATIMMDGPFDGHGGLAAAEAPRRGALHDVDGGPFDQHPVRTKPTYLSPGKPYHTASPRRSMLMSPGSSPRITMPDVPMGGHLIGLKNGLYVACRFPPARTVQSDEAFTRRFDEASYVLPTESPSAAVPNTLVEMVAELREGLLREDVLVRVIDQFRKYDLNGNGLVSREEFRRALPLLGLRGFAFSDMDMLFDAIDTNKSNQIEYAEMWRLLREGASVKLEDERLKAGAVPFHVREKGASSACRSSARDSRFESKPLKKASVEEMRLALKRDRTRIIDAFRCLDKNGNGAVSKTEFRAALPVLGFENDPETADKVFEELDEDGSGQLEYEELHKKLRQGAQVTLAPALQDGANGAIPRLANHGTPSRGGILTNTKEQRLATIDDIRESLVVERKRVIDVFRACDADESGKVSKREFRAALPTLGFGAGGRQAIDTLFSTFDLDANGTIEFSELNTMLRYEAARLSPRMAPPPSVD